MCLLRRVHEGLLEIIFVPEWMSRNQAVTSGGGRGGGWRSRGARSPHPPEGLQKSICALNFTNLGCSTEVGVSHEPVGLAAVGSTNVWL